MNVAVVVLDTLRYDAFVEQFNWLPGHRFSRAFAPGNWTVPVHGSMFTGLQPSEVGVHAKHRTLDTDEPTLAEMLHQKGYKTRAFSANPNISPIFRFDRGFDEFRGSWRLRGMRPDVFDWEGFIAEHRSRGPGRYLTALKSVAFGDVATAPSLRRGFDIKLRDLGLRPTPEDDGAGEVLRYVESLDVGDREFLFLNLMEAHAPYDPPEEYLTVDPGTDDRSWSTYAALKASVTDGPPEPASAERLEAAYYDSVRYLSDMYERIFAELRSSYDSVITLGDHGELFGKYGAWQHAYGLYPELTHVPLVVSGDAVADGSTATPVSLTTVFDTVAELTDIGAGDPERPLVYPDGTVRDHAGTIYTEYHGVDERNRGKAGIPERDLEPYDRRLVGIVGEDGTYGYQTRDGFAVAGGETTDVADRHEELESLAESYLGSMDARKDAGDDDVPAAVLRQLEELGYA